MFKATFLISPLLLLFSYWGLNPGHTTVKLTAQNTTHATSKDEGATIHGRVYLPSTTTKKRVFRGSAYRGRGGASGSTQTENDDTNGSPFQNTIISALPLSYKIDTQPLEKPAQIIQENATFSPHITPVTVGSTIQFINNDPFFHNVFSLKPGARFNIGRRPTGAVVDQKIPRVEEVTIQGLGEISIFCDIHSQMNAVILSLDTPYFVRVGKDGTYKLSGLPAGRYELRAYNPQFNISEIEVTVKDNEDLQQDFNFAN